MTQSSRDIHAVFGSDTKTIELDSYPKSCFISELGQISDYFIPVSKSHMHALVRAGNFIKKFKSIDNFLWDKQREIDIDRVNSIIEYLDGKPVGLRASNQCVTIATVKGDDPRVIDGQHRFVSVLKMDEDTPFLIQALDFNNNDDRFLEFVVINSNTPLPDYYKSITSRDKFYKQITDMIHIKILIAYKNIIFNVNDSRKYGFISQSNLRSGIYGAIQQRQPEMTSDIEAIVNSFMDLLKDPILFPPEVMHYPVAPLNAAKCKSSKSEMEKYIQCSCDPKDNGFCGRHVSMKNPYNQRLTRNFRFDEIKNCGHFILDPAWITKVIDKLYPLVYI